MPSKMGTFLLVRGSRRCFVRLRMSNCSFCTATRTSSSLEILPFASSLTGAAVTTTDGADLQPSEPRQQACEDSVGRGGELGAYSSSSSSSKVLYSIDLKAVESSIERFILTIAWIAAKPAGAPAASPIGAAGWRGSPAATLLLLGVGRGTGLSQYLRLS